MCKEVRCEGRNSKAASNHETPSAARRIGEGARGSIGREGDDKIGRQDDIDLKLSQTSRGKKQRVNAEQKGARQRIDDPDQVVANEYLPNKPLFTCEVHSGLQIPTRGFRNITPGVAFQLQLDNKTYAELFRPSATLHESGTGSHRQRRIWNVPAISGAGADVFFEQLAPASAVYNLSVAIRIDGPLDHKALAESIAEICRRHEILRTRIVLKDGTPFQKVESESKVSPRIVELPANAGEEDAMRVAAEELRRPLTLVAGPLLRLTLLRRSPEQHWLIVTIHHAIADGWSLGVFVRELRAIYPAILAGRPSPLRALPLQYRDFAAQQQALASSDALRAHLDYWRTRLTPAPAPLDLPTDRPRPRVQTFHGARQSFELPADLIERLKVLGREHHATLFMVLLATLKVLLFRYSGQTDICVGTPIATRNSRALWGMIGLFVKSQRSPSSSIEKSPPQHRPTQSSSSP